MIKLYNLQKITSLHQEEYLATTERVVKSGWYLLGKETKHFEDEYAQHVGTRHCIATGNGLDALKLMLRGYKEMGRLHDGDEVLVPANTYIATILAITENNLTPILIEPTWENLETDASRMEERIGSRTRAMLTVHMYGRIAYDEMMADICRRHNLLLLEDCAQSHGCMYGDTMTGALGNAAAHSFYPGKNLGAFGDAGAVTTNDDELDTVIRSLANYGSTKKYIFKHEGVNSRISEMDAAILSVKLKYLKEDNAQRQKLAAYYYAHISNPLITLPKRIPDAQNVYHQFPIFCTHRDALQQHLTANGIETLIHYPIPPHKQECYRQWNSMSLPITERICAEELSIPMSPVITENEAQEVVKAINEFAK